jgi:hypothetical protein
MSLNFRLVTEVLHDAARTGRARIDRVEEVEAAFGSVDAFLLAAHHRWRTAFLAHLDALIEDPPDDSDGAVLALWNDPTTGGRGLRALLDAHADRPGLAAAHEQDRLLVRRDIGVDVPSLLPRPYARQTPGASSSPTCHASGQASSGSTTPPRTPSSTAAAAQTYAVPADQVPAGCRTADGTSSALRKVGAIQRR